MKIIAAIIGLAGFAQIVWAVDILQNAGPGASAALERLTAFGIANAGFVLLALAAILWTLNAMRAAQSERPPFRAPAPPPL